MKVQIGDRVTLKNLEGNKVVILIKDDVDVQEIKDILKTRKLLKIERPKYEVVQENKDLLTEEEREFLRLYIKMSSLEATYIMKEDNKPDEFILKLIQDKEEHYTYFKKNCFIGLELNKAYTLSELGLEE